MSQNKIRKCPSCKSERDIQTERRPNGNSKCMSCGHVGPTKSFDVPEKKWLVFGDDVQSINDSNTHYVSSRELVHLYGLNIDECHCFDKWDENAPMPKGYYTLLKPRAKGDYKEYLENIVARENKTR